MERFRQHISSFCGLSHTFYHSTLNTDEGINTDEARKLFQEIDKLRYLIRLMLKPELDQDPLKGDAEYERKIKKLIDKIPDLVMSKGEMEPGKEKELFTAINDRVETSGSLLKDVWELIKRESKMEPKMEPSFLKELKKSLKQKGWL
jgi:hypothetical protein